MICASYRTIYATAGPGIISRYQQKIISTNYTWAGIPSEEYVAQVTSVGPIVDILGNNNRLQLLGLGREKKVNTDNNPILRHHLE